MSIDYDKIRESILCCTSMYEGNFDGRLANATFEDVVCNKVSHILRSKLDLARINVKYMGNDEFHADIRQRSDMDKELHYSQTYGIILEDKDCHHVLAGKMEYAGIHYGRYHIENNKYIDTFGECSSTAIIKAAMWIANEFEREFRSAELCLKLSPNNPDSHYAK